MTKNTTDELREQIRSILNSYSDAITSTSYDPKPNARPKAIERIEALISNREKLARLNEAFLIGVEYERGKYSPVTYLIDRKAIFRKELDGGQR